MTNKTWVIPDIHGCFNTLKALIENQIQPKESDRIIFLGDYIDRGNGNRKVLDYLMQLQKDNPSYEFLMGNHEEYFTNAYDADFKRGKKFLFFEKDNELQKQWERHGGKDTFNEFSVERLKDVPSNYISWIKGLKKYYETDDFIFVHAGLNFKIDNPFEDEKAMLWIREYKVVPEKVNFRKIIHGHMPVNMEFIKLQLENYDEYPYLALDNGVYLTTREGFGNLVAYELTTRELKVQPNIDL